MNGEKACQRADLKRVFVVGRFHRAVPGAMEFLQHLLGRAATAVDNPLQRLEVAALVTAEVIDALATPQARMRQRRQVRVAYVSEEVAWQDREQALFVQDLVRLGNWTFSAGLRWDHYRLITGESAVSPRLGAAWYWPAADLVLRGLVADSYLLEPRTSSPSVSPKDRMSVATIRPQSLRYS